MKHKSSEELLNELRCLKRSDSGPFPYAGCRKLLSSVGEDYEGLIPDLNTYWMDIAGFASWDYEILKWSDVKISEVKNWLRLSLFERYPRYKPLASCITETGTPDLYACYKVYEEMRVCLLQLLASLERETPPCSDSGADEPCADTGNTHDG